MSDDLEKHITQHLNKKLDDNEIERDLLNARMAALDKVGKPSVLENLFKPVPVTAFATASVAALALVLMNTTGIEQVPVNSVADLEILMTEDKLEFYEDLEFYQWLLLENGHTS